MTPEQFQQFLKSNEEATGRAIKIHVNGKIDKMVDKLDHHLEKFNEHVVDDKKFQDGVQDNMKWGVRLIIGAVILGVLANVLK